MFATLNQSTRPLARRNGAASLQSKEPIPMERLRLAAPSVFAGEAHSTRSERYTYVPTSQIVEHLHGKGFGVFAAMQSGSRNEDKRGHTKHLLRFRHANQTLTVGGMHPEIVLVNSHDGSTAYQLMAGLFRLVCANGMIVAASLIDDVRIHHKGDILGDVAKGIEQIAEQLPRVEESIRTMQAITLNPEEQGIFARAALSIKYDDAAPINESKALAVRRPEDAAPTLWNVMNRVQETLVKGGDRYIHQSDNGRRSRRSTQAVNSVDGTTRINRAVWQLAEEMAKLKR